MNTPAQGGAASEADELQLPVLGLYADLELGSGSVLLPDEFLACPGLVQLQIIGQWQRSLACCRSAAWRQLQHDVAMARPDLNAAERQALLSSTCASLGIELGLESASNPAAP